MNNSYQSWIREYAASQYLRKQSDDVLKCRYDALASNLWSTDAAGNVTPPRNPQHREAILMLLVHVLCERRDRAGSSSFIFDEAEIRRSASAAYQPPRLTTPFVGPPSGFAKFGWRKDILRTFEKGVLRVAPASAFNDPSLNSAQRDDELQHWAVMPNEHIMMKLIGLDDRGNEVELPFEKGELFRGMNVPDFYVWCCGFGYDLNPQVHRSVLDRRSRPLNFSKQAWSGQPNNSVVIRCSNAFRPSTAISNLDVDNFGQHRA